MDRQDFAGRVAACLGAARGTADHLAEQYKRLGRAGDDRRARFRGVEARREYTEVADYDRFRHR